MPRFVIERDIPEIGSADRAALKGASQKSREALAKLAPAIQWEHSYVTGNKTFCIYLADSEDMIHKHAELSGFPATVVTEVKNMIDLTTAE